MITKQNDAAFSFVAAANKKEAQNAQERQAKLERRKTPNPKREFRINLLLLCVFGMNLALTFMDGQAWYASFWGVLMSFAVLLTVRSFLQIPRLKLRD